jgi:valyl-tRNA synthetase
MSNQEISTKYNPKEIEEKWYKFWQENRFFNASPERGSTPYTIVIPPPNITGILHMGHALNNTIQDILIRWKRMQRFNALWMPGTDHAGIATQNVVEKKLKKEGVSRQQLGRENFINEVWKWREEYGNTIINQLKKMGCSCDWDRTRFTMDEGLSEAVQEVFIRLYEKGFLYRGDYIINWCPRCQTALSDEESEHEELKGFLYFIKYSIKGESGFVTVATTRPETMLGDTAVAVNPKDKRYKKLHGKSVVLPMIGREIPVILDDYVDPKFGTGVVKITPAHDPNDFNIGQKHKLPLVNVMNDDATMNENAGDYNGQDRFECREELLVDLKERDLLFKTETHVLSVGHCYRCHTIVEPRVSRQWFVSMKPLAHKAIEVVEKGEIKFVPSRWNKVYLDWMYNIRDWCISRQIWWGHRIPVWYCKQCQTEKSENINKGVIVSKTRPKKCPSCGNVNLEQDPDVLDTWFSSWLWPFSTMGWPKETPELKFYYPTDTLVTAQEIIFFWVARMIMSGLNFMGKIPFNTVYIHGTVRDETGRKMSKSLGNIIDPLEIINEFGADALRFSIISITSQGQDVFLSKHQFETGRNFTNKIWNASRFLLLNLQGKAGLDGIPSVREWNNDDIFIMGKLQIAIKEVTRNLSTYHFKEATQNLYDFFWRDFCDKYIEAIKPVLYGADEAAKLNTQKILYFVLGNTMKLLHPFMPFITEEIWNMLGKKDSIMTGAWPEYDSKYLKKDIVEGVTAKFELINKGRSLRSEYNIEPAARLNFYIKPHEEEFLKKDIASLKKLLGAEDVVVDKDFKPISSMPSSIGDAGTIYMSLKGVDLEKEKQRIEKEIQAVEREIEFVEKKLNNEQFCAKAPKEVIEKERKKKEEFLEKKKKLTLTLQML